MPSTPWWEWPRYAYRPQYLQLALLLQERQPTGPMRLIDLALAWPLAPVVIAIPVRAG